MAIIKLEDGRSELYQWDTGRKVVIDDESIKRVHYQNRFYGRTIDVDVSGGFAIIPDQLLQSFAPLVVFAWAGSDEDGYTKIEKTFKVNKRNKPSDYVFTPTDQKTLDGLQKQIGDLANLKTAAKENLVVAINEAAASGGGGADWSQNDPGGGGYVANRPGGYLTDPIVTDADAFTITSTEDGDGTYYRAVVAVDSSAITPSVYAIGDGVIVDFGGQSYSLTWQSVEGMPACGAAVTGEAPDWSSAPFCIIALFGEKGSLQAYYIYLQNAVTSPIQVKIKKAKQTPVKIPIKYLESDVYIVKVTSKSNEQRPGVEESDISYDVTVSATYDDIVAAVNAGKMPILLGEPVLSDPVLRLVDINTDTVDGAIPKLTFGGAYFRQSDRLYGTCAVIYSTGEATCLRYDSRFVNRLKDVDDAMSDTSYNLVSNRVIKKYVDDRVAGGLSLGLTSAAVGQIAKITAVDASGAPTAWGPVDMPAGVPSVTAADNGKFLRVVNGAWAAAEISSANGVSF